MLARQLARRLSGQRWPVALLALAPSAVAATRAALTTAATAAADDALSLAQSKIRNFAILAHIDHGKSTLADRLMQATNTITDAARKERPQMLDTLVVERERGITIKANSVSMLYRNHMLNLIDTPGHVDFSYEVSRSLEACQGAVLVIDATQGIQAQTLANFFLAKNKGLHILPVINKIDLPSANIDSCVEQIGSALGLSEDDVLLVSAKTGEGVPELCDAIVDRFPPPRGDPRAPLRMLLFDSRYDAYRGVVSLMAIVDGSVKAGDAIVSHATGKQYTVASVGLLKPHEVLVPRLSTGEMGFVTATMRASSDALVGDTFFAVEKPSLTGGPPTAARKPITEFRLPKPMVFAGLYPVDPSDYEPLRTAVERLVLNDPSVSVRGEQSAALGSGFRCGFLGLLHMDVFRQRLETEHDADVINTVATVPYEYRLRNGTVRMIGTAMDVPHVNEIETTLEPMVDATIVCPPANLGPVLQLCQSRRGVQTKIEALNTQAMVVQYRLPLSEVITDFFDTLKSKTAGYASFDYEESGYDEAPCGVLAILLNGDPVDALAAIVHKDRAVSIGKRYAAKLSEVIPRQMFEIRIQATYAGKVVARETISAFRKGVIDGLSGGDVTRKKKLLEKQKKGKKKMREIGSVSIPKEAFMSVLKSGVE